MPPQRSPTSAAGGGCDNRLGGGILDTMSEDHTEPDAEVKRWTASRKAAVALDLIKGKTNAAQVARKHALTVSEVERWLDEFLEGGKERLRSRPRDVEARHAAEKKQLLAKIGELTMDAEVYKIAAEIQGKELPDAS